MRTFGALGRTWNPATRTFWTIIFLTGTRWLLPRPSAPRPRLLWSGRRGAGGGRRPAPARQQASGGAGCVAPPPMPATVSLSPVASGHTPHSKSCWCVYFWLDRQVFFYTRHKVTLQGSGTRVFRVGCSETTQVPLFPETTLLEGAAGGTLLGCSQPAGLDSVKKNNDAIIHS